MLVFNPNTKQKIERNIGRIKTLKQAIAQTKDKKRKASLKKELDRRAGELIEIKKQIDDATK